MSEKKTGYRYTKPEKNHFQAIYLQMLRLNKTLNDAFTLYFAGIYFVFYVQRKH